jgi:hypothetical protein
MAAYQGARRTHAPLVRFGGRRSAGLVRARGGNRVVLVLAALLLAFLLGLFYVTQALDVATTDYQIGTLQAQRADIGRQLRSVEGDIARWGAEPAIGASAQALGFDRLGNPTRLPAR